jgi:protein-L-isoaspartate(D-aspartate) O-methyltransferase
MMDINQARFNMIEQQLRPARVLAADVLTLFGEIKREDFVPPAYRHLAFAATAIPLGHGAHMFTPEQEARALQALAMRRHEQVLEIGTGSGYMAALLGAHADHVLSYEIEPALADSARVNLKHARVRNVQVVTGDGLATRPIQDQFHVIMVSGAVADVPQILLDQLKSGGRLFAVTGMRPALEATLIHRIGDYFERITLFETDADFLRGAEPAPRFVF